MRPCDPTPTRARHFPPPRAAATRAAAPHPTRRRRAPRPPRDAPPNPHRAAQTTRPLAATAAAVERRAFPLRPSHRRAPSPARGPRYAAIELDAPLSSGALLGALGASFTLGAVVAATTRDGVPPSPPAYAAGLALFGFAIAATWIDAIADQLVGMLEFLGVALGIPTPVLGLTVLAWGNSVGDLSTNMAMARKGLANMARRRRRASSSSCARAVRSGARSLVAPCRARRSIVASTCSSSLVARGVASARSARARVWWEPVPPCADTRPAGLLRATTTPRSVLPPRATAAQLIRPAPRPRGCCPPPRRRFAVAIPFPRPAPFPQAITACFAGPVFNMLVGLGAGFALRLSDDADTDAGGSGARVEDVHLSTGLACGFAFLAFNCVAIGAFGVFNQQFVPKVCGSVCLFGLRTPCVS